jgi:hypothetical protein
MKMSDCCIVLRPVTLNVHSMYASHHVPCTALHSKHFDVPWDIC